MNNIHFAYFCIKGYKFAFNGKEAETNFTEGVYDFGARLYDSRLGRWWSVDPLFLKYSDLSTYVFVGNSPIEAFDPDGKKIKYVIYNTDGTYVSLTYKKGNFYFDNTGQKYKTGTKSSDPTLDKLISVYNKIEMTNDKELTDKLHKLESSSNIHWIQKATPGNGSEVSPYTGIVNKGKELAKKGKSVGTTTELDFSKEQSTDFKDIEGIENSPETTVVQEMQHQYDFEIGNMKDNLPGSSSDPAEIRAAYLENRMRKYLGLPKRTTYGGVKFDLKKLNNPPNYIK